MRQSLPSSQRGPLPLAPDAPPSNLVRSNRSSSSLSSSFLAGFFRPEVADRPFPEVGGRQKSGSNTRRVSLSAQSDLSDELVDRKPEAATAVAMRLPQLRITPGGKQLWLSREHDVTAASTVADDDVTYATKTGNATDEGSDGELLTVSSATLSMTKPLDADNITAAPEVVAAGKNYEENSDYVEQPRVVFDDNQTHGGTPFHVVDRHQQVPVWPAVPQHHLTLYQPAQQSFVPPSFGRHPGQLPNYGSSSHVHGPPAVKSVDVPSVSGQGSAGWRGVNIDGPASLPPVISPVNQAVPNDKTSRSKGIERVEYYNEGLSVDEEPTTWTTTSHAGTTSSDEAGDTAVLIENDDDLRRNHPSTRHKSTTVSSSSKTVKSTVTGRTDRGRSWLWGTASLSHSSSAALSATTFHIVGTCERFIIHTCR